MEQSLISPSRGIQAYVFDESIGVHLRPGSAGIGYRDGVEDNLKKIATIVNDRSTFSDEFIGHMTDWPSEYHFSRKRHLVLRPFDIKKGDRVLELGSGCGSITRYLAEIGAEVTAVEGEKARASVAAKRCRGFPNVRFIADNFLSLNLEEKFDWVLMIGVFEYSQKYAKSADRQREYLDIVLRHLDTNGTLIIAIENKIGIKYLNGAGEDHNGKRFYGPQDLYSDNDITTWGRTEIREKLAAAGFHHSKFFAAFPDYKLPKVLFSEDIDDQRQFRAEELLHYVKSLDYRGKNERVFDESMVLGSLRKNGLMVDFANSFVIACSLRDLGERYDPNVLAHYYSVDRKKSLCTETKFLSGVNGKISVIKNSIDRCASTPEVFIFVTTEAGDLIRLTQYKEKSASQYFDGQLMGFEISKALKKEDVERLTLLVNTWIAFLIRSFKLYCRDTGVELNQADLNGRPMSKILVDGVALDCGPHNIILGESITAFDLEWHSDTAIPLAWVLHRNAKLALRPKHSSKQLVKVENIIGFIAQNLGAIAMTSDIEEAIYLENQFQAGVALVEPSGKRSLTDAIELR
ncbi:MAG: class I SAM-dependent methyltransferase [Gammaproteobacteria bacterium]|nr:class I SAM-dependent methyltransferase [Gammaproteobacteria bacterium]